MTTSPPPSGDDDFVWGNDLPAKPSGDAAGETYHIPGGLSGWTPGDIAPGKPSVRKVPRRDDPAVPPVPTTKRTRGRSPTWALLGLNLLVFVASVCVMTLELTASRLIAKHVGNSLYTWTSVIGVVLAGITVGNWLGGWLADRWNRTRTLAWMFLLASMASASVLWLDQLVADIPRPEGLSWPAWIVCVVGMMFLLPAVLLGTTSPLIASLALERSTHTGATVGNVYAWGAAGSIAGTFLTGFYLVDVWGSRAIIGMTAATLALLALLVAGQRWAFRTAVVVGWLQGLTWLTLLASLTPAGGALWGYEWGRALTFYGNSTGSMTRVQAWRTFGDQLGTELQSLGLLLKLRDDVPGVYHDESSYSYIQVRDDHIDGAPVRALRLDKLDHSYFEPAQPTTLHYEYEQVYAAITRHAAPAGQTLTAVPLPQFPGRDDLLSRLPEGATFEEGTQELRLANTEPVLLRRLMELSDHAPYWAAVEQLQRETSLPNWGGFTAVGLSELPAGLTLPAGQSAKVRFDPQLETLAAYEVLSLDDREQLLALGPQAPWKVALDRFRGQTASLGTLFIGGGGFIFPRWILAEYPTSSRIDVAELDPAVHQAVRREMGLTDAENERIRTVYGDARNFVEDAWRANQTTTTPIHYDFVYGDAFNDLSVPWHLTTEEFTRKVHDLLTPRGVYLANIIDIYPRTPIPGGTLAESYAELTTTPPDGLFEEPREGVERAVRLRFRPLEVVGGTKLKFSGPMAAPLARALRELAPEDAGWLRAVNELEAQSARPQTLGLEIPAALVPDSLMTEEWTPCPAPFEGLEIFRDSRDGYQLAIRGLMSPELVERLRGLRPADRTWTLLIDAADQRARQGRTGRFLGRYVETMTRVFPYVAVFCTSQTYPADIRDTFVVAGARSPLDLSRLEHEGAWRIAPFAEFVQPDPAQPAIQRGDMAAVRELAEGQPLTDDFAPVDNLLRAVFDDQGT